MNIQFSDLLSLLGALGLFLYGMKVMSDALIELAGQKMRGFMARLTSNRVSGIATGVVITGLIQSSSATTLMVVTFTNAGLMRLTEAISVIMGANIGTTFTAWLITILGFKVNMSSIALPLMLFAVILYLQSRPLFNRWGRFIAGFALLFIGLEFMKDAVPDLQNNPELYDIIRHWSGMGFTSTLIFIGIGTLLTLILQSSSATMAITLVAASQGWLPFSAAAAMVLGENIGTTITANMAALVANVNARRAALAHLLFNLFGVIWILVLFNPVLAAVDRIAASQGGHQLTEVAAIPIGLAIFHSFFNIANMLLLLGFVGAIARFVERLLPEKPAPISEESQPHYLQKNYLKYPETGIDALVNESKHLYTNAIFEVIAHGTYLHRHHIRSELPAEQVVARSRDITKLDFRGFVEEKVQPIYTAIIDYSNQLQQQATLTLAQQDMLTDLKHANRDTLIIVTNIGYLNHDLMRYLRSNNETIQREYNRLRVLLVEMIRRLAGIMRMAGIEQRLSALDALFRDVKKNDRRLIAEVDILVGDQKITPEMGAHLISSSAALKRLGRNLVRVARRLYGQDFAQASAKQKPTEALEFAREEQL